MTKCFGCGIELTPDNDSDAHMIPRALGGRLAPRGIICRSCNSEFNSAADQALIDAFGAWPALLNLPVQGSVGAKTVDTREGNRVRLESDGKLTQTNVIYSVEPMPEIEGYRLTLGAGDMKTARQLLARAQKQFPQLNLAEAQKHLKKQGMPSSDELKLDLNLSPDTLGGVLTAVWLFLIHKTGQAFVDKARLLSWVRNLRSQQNTTFRYLMDGLPGLEGPDIKLGHKIVLRAVPASGHLVAYVEILGALKVGGVIAHITPGAPLEHIYVYDLLEQRDRSAEFSISPDTFDIQDWKTIGLMPADTDALRSKLDDAQQHLASLYYATVVSDTDDSV